MDQLICASLSHTHYNIYYYWYEVGMLKVPAITCIILMCQCVCVCGMYVGIYVQQIVRLDRKNRVSIIIIIASTKSSFSYSSFCFH